VNSPRRPAPLLLRAFDALTAGVRQDLVDLEVEAVTSQARAATGCEDFGHPGYLRRLEAMVSEAAAHPRLTTSGRIALRIFLHWHATNRLREVELLAAHPEIRAIPVPEPLVIVGGYRTGTTHLHSLLAADASLRAPRAWEVCFPIPLLADRVADRSRRRRNTRAVFALNQFIMPDQLDVHTVLLDGPEECHFLLENAALSMTQYIAFGGHGYARWLLGEDVKDAYDSLRAQYQILSWLEREEHPEQPLRPWLLKCPLHTWHLEQLMRALPGARLLWTHRSMDATVASTCGLSAVTSTKFLSELDGAELGRFWIEYYEAGLERGLAARDAHPEWSVLDVRLADLVRDPEAELARIHAALGREPSAAALEAVHAELARQAAAKDAPGKHRYTPEEFGTSGPALRERFAAYEARFGLK
jgi:hypothetical protein